MINWEFDPSNVEERSFEPLPPGDYRVRIEDVEQGEGKYEYYKVTLKVSRDNRRLWYYLSFMTGKSKNGKDLKAITDTNLHNLWNSFGIDEGDLDYNHWIGKVGACRVKHEMYNGEPQARVSYFISKDRQDKLPPWSEEPAMKIDDDFTLLDDDEDDEIPF